MSARRILATDVYESFGNKLRRLAREADVSNLSINPSYVAPIAWVTATVYIKGDVRSNAGNWYQAITNGTSGASAPTGQSPITAVSDGTVQWIWIGTPKITANDATAPTITIATTTALTNGYDCFNRNWCYRYYGGYTTQAFGFLRQIMTFNTFTATPFSGTTKIGFWTDAPKFSLGFGNQEQNAPISVSIDGRYYSEAGHVVNGGANPTYVTYDFTATTNRKNRYILIEFANTVGPYFYGCVVGTGDLCWAPSVQDDIRTYIIGDSIFSGSSTYGPFGGNNFLGTKIAQYLGWSDTWTACSGGTGWVANNGGLNYTYGQRVAEGLTRTPDLWLFMGSTNDGGQGGVTAATTAALTAIRAGGSKAPIIVLGVLSVSAGTTTVETQVSAGVSAFTDPLGLTFFIPISNDPSLAWITGAWNNAALPNSVNSASYISGDNIHPSILGVSYLGQRIATAIRNNVYPSIQ